MPNVFTRIPEGDPPRLPAAIGALVPVADAFMYAMVSRPSTGSLRRTWVTPASLWLALATAVAMVALLVVVLTRLDGVGRLIAVVLIGLTLAGSASVAAVGAAQRRA